MPALALLTIWSDLREEHDPSLEIVLLFSLLGLALSLAFLPELAAAN